MKRLGCLLVLLGLVGFGGAAWRVASEVRQARALFGPPTETLGVLETWRLSHTLATSSRALLTPRPAAAEGSIEIAPGETAAAVARRLQNAGVVPSAPAFLAYLRYKGWDTKIQAGVFRWHAPLSPVALAARLRQTPPKDAVLVVLPGWRREEIAAAVPASGLTFTPRQFLAATARAAGAALPLAVPANAPLEGFCAPGTYTFPRSAAPAEVVAAMLRRMAQWLNPAWQQAVRAEGLTPYHAVILASIVQRETRHADEMPHIAAVYLNRLRRAMPLEADPTVQYALGKPQNWWPAPLSAASLRVASPYNTYRHLGLPPTPIANPSRQALQAVAHPLATDDLFFRAACDGSGRHVFSRTFRQHLQHACP
jgi:UPF0755 protein